MVRAFWWYRVKQVPNSRARRRGRRDQYPRRFRPWLNALETRLAPTVMLSVSNPTPFPKPDTGQVMGMFVINRSGDLAPAVQVRYQTQDGSGPTAALAGVDYVATSGTLTLAPQQTTAMIAVPILGNNLFQVNKTFTVRLSVPLSSDAFAPPQTFAAGSTPVAVAVGDFNGDGKPDLAVINNPSSGQPGTVTVLLNTTPTGATTPSFAPPQTFAVGINPGAVAVGDFNGDGKADLAVVNDGDFQTNPGSVSVLLNTTPRGATTASFSPQQTFAAGPHTQALAVGDFNGDGKPDLAIANSVLGPSPVSVLLNTTPVGATTLTFAPPQTFDAGVVAHALAVGDFNGDGKPDLAVVSGGTLLELLNTTPVGATTPSFAPAQTFDAGGGVSSVAVGDFNSDGKADLAIANDTFPNPAVSVLLGNGDGTFLPAVSFSTARSFLGFLGVADINGDGKPDLVGTDGNAVAVLMNQVLPVTLTGSPAIGTISSDPEAPTSITVVPGTTPQSTIVNTAFAVPLAVDVRDAAGHLVQGASVIFTAPGHGPSGTFDGHRGVAVLTDAAGRATAPLFLANTRAGSYGVKAEAAGGSDPGTRFDLTNTAGAIDHFAVTTDASNPDVAGTPFNITVAAQDAYGNTVTDYTGTVHFRSNDPQALLPADYTFTAADQGVHTFIVSLETAGRRHITVRDTANHAIKGRATIFVIPGAADHLRVATAEALAGPITMPPRSAAASSFGERASAPRPDGGRSAPAVEKADALQRQVWAPVHAALPAAALDHVLRGAAAGLFSGDGDWLLE